MPIRDYILEGEPIYYCADLSPELESVVLVPISDAHYGNPLFSRRHFYRTIKYIEDTPNAFTFLNGDLCEAAIRTSKGEIFHQAGSPQDQWEWITEKLYPIKDKILGMTLGNHENRIYNEVGIDICKEIAKSLNVPYRAPGMMLKISYGDGNKSTRGKPYVFWGYFTHGYGGARTKSSKAVKVERTATWVHADWYALSHDHVVNVAPDTYLMPDPRSHEQKDKDGKLTGFRIGKASSKRKMLIKTNAYIKWGGYAEMGGFPPVDLTTPIIKLLPTGLPLGSARPTVRVEV